MHIRKIETNQTRNLKNDQKRDRRKRQLRSPLNLEEKVLVLAERLKEKDAPGSLYKASTENIPFFNGEHIFTIYKRAKLENRIYFDDDYAGGRWASWTLDSNLQFHWLKRSKISQLRRPAKVPTSQNIFS